MPKNAQPLTVQPAKGRFQVTIDPGDQEFDIEVQGIVRRVHKVKVTMTEAGNVHVNCELRGKEYPSNYSVGLLDIPAEVHAVAEEAYTQWREALPRALAERPEPPRDYRPS